MLRELSDYLVANLGWRGFLVALVLVLALFFGGKAIKAVPKPTEPAPPPKMPDVPDVPDATWGENTDPDDRPPG